MTTHSSIFAWDDDNVVTADRRRNDTQREYISMNMRIHENGYPTGELNLFLNEVTALNIIEKLTEAMDMEALDV